MTTQLDDLTRPAQNPESTPMTGIHGEGVKAVALFESRKPRPWDELSEIDRAVLLESVRQRRKHQAHKQKIYSELFGMRINK
jgi:hypothetical protein